MQKWEFVPNTANENYGINDAGIINFDKNYL